MRSEQIDSDDVMLLLASDDIIPCFLSARNGLYEGKRG